MQIAHSSQQVSAEQINKFAISKDEYVGGLGKELTAKKLKEEFLLLKTDMLMEPRISLFWSKLMRLFISAMRQCVVYSVLCKFVRDCILIINRGAVNCRLRNDFKGRGLKWACS